MSCSVGHRRSSDLTWLWLCCRLAAAAPIRPLAWEPPYAMGVALKSRKKKMKEVNLKRLHTIRLQLYDILEKAKLWTQLKKKKKSCYGLEEKEG